MFITIFYGYRFYCTLKKDGLKRRPTLIGSYQFLGGTAIAAKLSKSPEHGGQYNNKQIKHNNNHHHDMRPARYTDDKSINCIYLNSIETVRSKHRISITCVEPSL
jgi:hypothetical protein